MFFEEMRLCWLLCVTLHQLFCLVLAFSTWLAAMELYFSTGRASGVLILGHFVLSLLGESGEESGLLERHRQLLCYSRLSAPEI